MGRAYVVFSMECYKIVLQRSLVVYHGISHLSLVFPRYSHELLGKCVHRENTSDSWEEILVFKLNSPFHVLAFLIYTII